VNTTLDVPLLGCQFLRWFPNPLRHSLLIQIRRSARKVCRRNSVPLSPLQQRSRNHFGGSSGQQQNCGSHHGRKRKPQAKRRPQAKTPPKQKTTTTTLVDTRDGFLAVKEEVIENHPSGRALWIL
jgi:hypothetical protein